MLFDVVQCERACYYALWLQNKYEALLELYAVPWIFSSATMYGQEWVDVHPNAPVVVKCKKSNFFNWGRQNTQSLQAVLAVAPLKKGKQLGDVRHFVCLSVHRTFSLRSRKWFKTFVRGTVRTEKTI